MGDHPSLVVLSVLYCTVLYCTGVFLVTVCRQPGGQTEGGCTEELYTAAGEFIPQEASLSAGERGERRA